MYGIHNTRIYACPTKCTTRVILNFSLTILGDLRVAISEIEISRIGMKLAAPFWSQFIRCRGWMGFRPRGAASRVSLDTATVDFISSFACHVA